MNRSVTAGGDLLSPASIFENSNGVWEVQTITLTALEKDLRGKFTLTYGGPVMTSNELVQEPEYTTTSLEYDVTAVDMKTALENLPNIGRVNVARFSEAIGYRWEVTFFTNAGNLPQLKTVSDTLTGSSLVLNSVETVQGVSPASNNVISGISEGHNIYVQVSGKNDQGYGISLTSKLIV